MRKIEEAMCAAVKERRNWLCDNTEVRVTNNGNVINVYLFGNNIYSDTYGEKRFTLAGWATNTTLGRLRALGLNICMSNHKPLYNGEYINSNKWYAV